MSEIEWKTQRTWWAYIPEVFEEGVIVDAFTLDEATALAQEQLLLREWDTQLRLSVVKNVGFFMYELGTLYQCNFNVEDDEE